MSLSAPGWWVLTGFLTWGLSAVRLLSILVLLGAMACSQGNSLDCPVGEYCVFTTYSGGEFCASNCACNVGSPCGAPDACPTYCPDAGTENLCPQGLVCGPAALCGGCDGQACPVSFSCVPPAQQQI